MIEDSRKLDAMPVMEPAPEITYTFDDNFTLSVRGDMVDGGVFFTATIPDHTYLAIGFGSDMIAVDMILWQANGDESASYDMWSSNFATPMYDKFDQLETTIEDGKIGSGMKVFTTKR